jgi:CheY-like chemotaxis protein
LRCGPRPVSPETTDDRRPTTDDRRPTTDDRRPTTDDRSPIPPTPTWHLHCNRGILRTPRRRSVPEWFQVAMAAQKILVIEDDNGARDALGCLLTEEGFVVRTEASGEAGIACAREFQPDVIVCDYYLPDIDGLHVLRCLRADQGGAFIIVVTGGGYGRTDEAALRNEADLFLDKPVDLRKLRAALQRVEGLPPRRPSTVPAVN